MRPKLSKHTPKSTKSTPTITNQDRATDSTKMDSQEDYYM